MVLVSCLGVRKEACKKVYWILIREELVQTVPSFAEQFSACIFFSKGNLQSEL